MGVKRSILFASFDGRYVEIVGGWHPGTSNGTTRRNRNPLALSHGLSKVLRINSHRQCQPLIHLIHTLRLHSRWVNELSSKHIYSQIRLAFSINANAANIDNFVTYTSSVGRTNPIYPITDGNRMYTDIHEHL